MEPLPQDPLKLMSQIGALCSDLGAHEQALAIFQQLVIVREDNPNALVSLALAQSRAGDEVAAASTLRRVLEREPQHEMASVMLAIHLHKAGDLNVQTLLQNAMRIGRDSEAMALAKSLQDEIDHAQAAGLAARERPSRHRYTRVGAD